MKREIMYLVPILVMISVISLMGTLLSTGVPTTPYMTITVLTPQNRTVVNAYVQVFALLPPGHKRSLVEVWNGTTNWLGQAYVPLSNIAPIAREWVEEGFGNAGVGLEVVVTYVNGTTLYSRFYFITYNPKDLLNTASLAMPFLNYRTISIRLERLGTININNGITLNIPTSPGPLGCPFCQWNLVWSMQTNTTYIPLIFAVDQYTSNTNFVGNVGAGVTQSTTLYFYASVATETTELIYEISGQSFYQSFSYSYNYTGDGFGYEWSIAAVYVQGTLGMAEFVNSCNSNYHAYETYVQSANLNALYTTHKVGTQYVSNALNTLNQYVGIVTVPFDEFDLSSAGQAYEYSYLYMQEYLQDYPFLYAIPVGAIIDLLEPQLIPFSLGIETSLFAEVQTQSTSVTYSLIAIINNQNMFDYGDLLGIGANVQYQYNGQTFYPVLSGFYVEPPGSYSASTNIVA
ncbi:hypothetical protein [Vulcanisaeta sp. JCM 16159]|uniref:hypothetical protein n=1 Tax=Vulcanisaeta sp. JCM 16159 TaxID=1295371 RepID=UPI001FB23FF4|nr:hypothetical protein [Vulcanisaeta sp. JCM 16159]